MSEENKEIKNVYMDGIRKGKYRHYKGKEYEVIGLARHSETLKELVAYRPLYAIIEPELACDFFVRPREMFFETVEVDGKAVPRFTFIGE